MHKFVRVFNMVLECLLTFLAVLFFVGCEAKAATAPGWSQITASVEYHSGMFVVGCNATRVFTPSPNSSDCSQLYLEAVDPPLVDGAIYGCAELIGYDIGMSCFMPVGGVATSIPVPTGFAASGDADPPGGAADAFTANDAYEAGWLVVGVWALAWLPRFLARVFRGWWGDDRDVG